MGRLRDSLHILLTGSTADVEIARMKTQFAALNIEIGNVMDKLGSKVGRMVKSDARAAKTQLAPEPVAQEIPQPDNRQARKLLNRMRRLGKIPATVAPTNGDEPE